MITRAETETFALNHGALTRWQSHKRRKPRVRPCALCVFGLEHAHKAHTVFRAHSLIHAPAHSLVRPPHIVDGMSWNEKSVCRSLQKEIGSVICFEYIVVVFLAAQHGTVPHGTRTVFLFRSQICAQPVFFMLTKCTFVRLAYIFFFFWFMLLWLLLLLLLSLFQRVVNATLRAAHIYFAVYSLRFTCVYGFLLNGWLGCAHGRM